LSEKIEGTEPNFDLIRLKYINFNF